VVGHRLADTFEAAALEAINIFCDQHPNEVVGYPIGLFPAADSRDPEWTFRVTLWTLSGRFDRRDATCYSQVYECTIPSSDTSAQQYELDDQYSPRLQQKH
jgi:hypothetical protein